MGLSVNGVGLSLCGRNRSLGVPPSKGCGAYTKKAADVAHLAWVTAYREVEYGHLQAYDLFGGNCVTAGFKYGSGAVIKHLEGVCGNISLDAIGVLALKE